MPDVDSFLTDYERRLGEVWKEVLGLKDIARATDFFSAGGDSFLAMRILIQVKKEFNIKLYVTDLFNAPTIESFARVIHDRASMHQDLDSDAVADRPDKVFRYARGKVVLRLVRAARCNSRGALLGMPSLNGDSGAVGLIAANAFDFYDIWGVSVDIRPSTLTENQMWFDVAEEIADRLLSTNSIVAKAFIGFSIGGFMGWLVDRMLVAAGRSATPVISFDGGLYQARFPGWFDRITPILDKGVDSDQARALLFMRGRPGSFTLIESPEDDWIAAGCKLNTFCHPTLDHMDLILPSTIAAARKVLEDFPSTSQITPVQRDAPFEAKSIGEKTFQLLDATSPPSADVVRDLTELSQLPADGTVRLGLLLLTMASGDAELALSFSQRLIDVEPHHRAAIYTRIAVLAAVGRRAEAMCLADSWIAHNPTDEQVRARATQDPQQSGVWGSWPELVLGDDRSLEFAVSLVGKTEQNAVARQ